MSEMRDILKRVLPQADERALERFKIYHRLLAEWNEKMNLTAITDPVEVAQKHFMDSLAALPYLKAGMRVIDVGTGAGFPGVPLLIMEPKLDMTLADSLQKRLTFLDALLRELDLKAALVHGRAEDLGQNKLYRERYDAATSRAVANLPVLLELTTPFVKVGGTAIAYKGDASEELENAKSAAFLLHVKLRSVALESDLGKRCLIFADKIAPTPKTYPRKAGTPNKKPL
ncbi:MAG: 16S rRNA (guanine(527)-N(7))-methyltransferase RsmG [Clostridia bacterium]|nr:16S rRNA (guanine(527)-N(7))-methyltransferase RsmG [Clostridia bacterium]